MSQHFSMTEMLRSDTAARRGIDNTPPPEAVAELEKTMDMLERIRSFLSERAGRDIPMAVTSGYRCPALNSAIGSAPTSDHSRGRAADWSAPAFGTPTQIARALAPNVDKLGIGQLINEFPDAHGWIHTSTAKPAKAINRIITITRAGTLVGIQGA